MGQARHPVRQGGKTACACTKEEIVAELWAQLKDGVNGSGRATLESARRAVNALLEADNSGTGRCRSRELFCPPEMEPLKRVDELRYRLGLPNTFDLG